MKKEKTKTAAENVDTAAQPQLTPTAATASSAVVEPRENPRVNEKIDEWIKQFPDDWKYFMSLPPERMARKLVLNEINKFERQQKAKKYRQEEQGSEETTSHYDHSQRSGNSIKNR